MRLPLMAVALGVLGLLPFAGSGLLAVTGDPVVATRALLALIGYGAIILAFLGAVHWGFVMPVLRPAGPLLATGAPPAASGTSRRLVLGVLPSLVGWGALLLAVFGWDDSALMAVIAGFIGTIIAEARAHRLGLLPPGYIWLRWGLTAGVLIVLVSVLILRVLGGNIVI